MGKVRNSIPQGKCLSPLVGVCTQCHTGIGKILSSKWSQVYDLSKSGCASEGEKGNKIK